MVSADLDVIVIGAGVSGLAALAELQQGGKRAICLEARDRIGGRIYTLHDPLSAIPIELGAEFIHGRPGELWQLIETNRLRAYDCNEHSLHLASGRVNKRVDAWLMVDKVMDEMKRRAASGPDISFEEFLANLDQPEDAKVWARSYIEGFNAASSDTVSITALAKESEASDSIDGDRSLRILDGYDSIALALVRRPEQIRLNSIVEGIAWSRGSVSVHVRSAMTGEVTVISAKHAVITVPLGVLQTRGLHFDPEPKRNLGAAHDLCFGQVDRIVLRFRHAVWTENEELADAGFILSQAPVFPTWWTPLPMRVPVITGWSAGPKANALAPNDTADVVTRALTQLAQITGLSADCLKSELERAYFHDWGIDPFARGAYSYVRAGLADARERLAAPVEDTLYFAGEAAEYEGHAATVHGAIIAGRRAARQILATSY